jgi:hypothetical protein
MMRFEQAAEPARWDERVRRRGISWLKTHPGYDRPTDYWLEFENDLAAAFGQKCAYCVMLVMRGDMDHFVPIARLKETSQDEMAYEWSNFRYVESTLNKGKSKRNMLDPFKVKNEWFEILLPSLQLQLTASVPKSRRKLAEFTLQELGLIDGEIVVRYRSKWFELYRNRRLDLDGLREIAPLIANAVEKDLANGIEWRK